MLPLRRAIGICSILVLAACGGDGGSTPEDGPDDDVGGVREREADDGGGAEMRTTEAGLHIIETTDPETGLHLEIQGDNLYLKLPDDPSTEVAALSEDTLGGSCEVADDAPFDLPELFPVYWRERSGDWGTALTRGLPVPPRGEPTLAEHVVECSFYGAPAGSDEIRASPEELITTIQVR